MWHSKIYAIIDALIFKQFHVCKGNAEAKMIASYIYTEIQKMGYPIVYMLSSFLLGYADSSSPCTVITVWYYCFYWVLAASLSHTFAKL